MKYSEPNLTKRFAMALILAMCAFSLSMSITPGPVNIICLSSGVNHGFRKTLPFVSGATIGFVLLLITIGSGLSSFADPDSIFLILLHYLGSGFIAFIGVKIIADQDRVETNKKQQSIPTFVDGALLQWLNPKAWLACVAGTVTFGVNEANNQLWLFVGIYFVICYLSIACWAIVGEHIKNWLKTPKNMRLVNFIMGGLLCFIAVYLVFNK